MISLPNERDAFFACVSLNSLEGFMLLPEEAKCLSPKASKGRREQFLMGRAASHKALKTIKRDGPLLRGVHGEPCWPDGIVGSLSHTDKIAVAAVASKDHFYALGIDLEDTDRVLKADIAARITLPEEHSWIKEVSNEEILRTYLLFSAKECVYKAFFPLSFKHIGFRDALLRWMPNENAFEVTMLNDINEKIPKDFKCKIKCDIQKNIILSYLLLPRSAT